MGNKYGGYTKVYEWGECEKCGKKTRWFPYTNYYHPEPPETECLCADCKHPKTKGPCKRHRLAFSNPNVPEAKNLDLRPCQICGYFIKRPYEKIYL